MLSDEHQQRVRLVAVENVGASLVGKGAPAHVFRGGMSPQDPVVSTKDGLCHLKP
jgi:hypothetical protein